MNLTNLGAPVLIGFFLLNMALSVYTALPNALSGAELAGCENVPAWACGGPFENIAKAGGGGNLSGWERLVAGTIGTVTALIGDDDAQLRPAEGRRGNRGSRGVRGAGLGLAHGGNPADEPSTVSIWFCRVDMLELTASILGGKPPVYG